MFEHKKAKLATREVYRRRLVKYSVMSMMILIVSLLVGILGYHFIARLEWIDAFMNAAMILGGMGPVDPLPDKTAMIFAGCYAIFCGVAFLLSMGVVVTPIVHRFYHKFHLEIKDDE